MKTWQQADLSTMSCQLLPWVLLTKHNACKKIVIVKNRVYCGWQGGCPLNVCLPLHLLERTLWLSLRPHSCDRIVASHVWMTTQTQKHTLPPLVCLVLGCQHSGSALHGAQRAVPGNRWWWPGRRAAGHTGSGHSEKCGRTCGLGWVWTGKILMQGFSSSLEQTVPSWREKLHPQHNAEGKMEVGQLLCCCCSSASLNSIPNTLSLHGYISVMVVRLQPAINPTDVLAWILQGRYIDDWLFNSNHAHTNPSSTWLDKLSIHWASVFDWSP